MVAVTGVAAAATGAGSAAVAQPSAGQQAQFETALAQAQVGLNGPTSGNQTETPTHLLMLQMFTQTVMTDMQRLEQARQEASQDD